MIEGNGAAAEKDQSECDGGESEREFKAAVSGQAVVPVNFDNGDNHIDADGKSRRASEKADQNEQAAEELGESGEIGAPPGEAEALHNLNVVMKSAKNLVVSMHREDYAKGEAHDEEREWLQTIEVAHKCLRKEDSRLP